MKITKQKRSLKDLIERLEWFAYESARTTRSLVTPDSVFVTFSENKRHPEKVDTVVIRIGKDVCDFLGWQKADKILPLFTPDDHMLFLMVKSDRGVGFSLGKETKSEVYRLQFKWNRDVPLERMPASQVEYEVYKKQLIFRVGESSDQTYD
jgi:hypothetical protein